VAFAVSQFARNGQFAEIFTQNATKTALDNRLLKYLDYVMMWQRIVRTMYQPTAPVVQFSQAPPQQAPVIQIMQQPAVPSYPVMPAVVVASVPEQKKDEDRETYKRTYRLTYRGLQGGPKK